MENEKKVDLSALSEKERKELLDALLKESKEREQQVRQERATYKKMVHESVMTCYPILQSASETLGDAKGFVYDTLGALVDIKAELYDSKDGQYSHTFTNEDGTVSITIGRNVNDGWDDTAEVGEAKVREYIESLAKDADSSFLVKALTQRLGKDKNKKLKLGNIIQLEKLAEERGDPKLIDAVKIIRDAYKPILTNEYIRCEHKNRKGQKVNLPLSITEATSVKEALPPIDNTENTTPTNEQ